MSSTATAHRHVAARVGSGSLLDFAVAAGALAGTLALLRHGGAAPTRAGSRELDPIGVALVAGSTVPLVASR
jgi:hypothetical protein